jgi:plasmid stability protein
MTGMTIRNLDDQLKRRLRIRAASRGRSMEEEAREILRAALSAEPHQGRNNLAERIRGRIVKVGGAELDIPEREPIREPIDFG